MYEQPSRIICGSKRCVELKNWRNRAAKKTFSLELAADMEAIKHQGFTVYKLARFALNRRLLPDLNGRATVLFILAARPTGLML